MRFEQVPARARRPRSAGSLAGAEGGAVSDRGGAGQLRARRSRPPTAQEFVVVAGAPRRRPRVRDGVRRRRRARRARRPRHVQRHQRGAGRRRSAPAGDWLLVHIAPDYASIAILRGEHLIFFRNRAADGEGTLADLVHQTAMYYEDRLSGDGFSRVVLAGGGSPARRPAGRRLSARAASRSGSAPRSNDRSAHRRDADRSHHRQRRRCSTRWRRSSALLRARSGRPACCGRTSRPGRSTTSAPCTVLLGCRRADRRRAHAVQRRRRSSLLTQPAADARRAGGARPKREPRELRGAAAADPRAASIPSSSRRRRTPRARPTTIIDQRPFSWTELFNRFETTLPDDVRITAVRPRVERDGTIIVPIDRRAPAASRISKRSWRTSKTTGAFSDVLSAGADDQRDGLIEAASRAYLAAAPRHRQAARPYAHGTLSGASSPSKRRLVIPVARRRWRSISLLYASSSIRSASRVRERRAARPGRGSRRCAAAERETPRRAALLDRQDRTDAGAERVLYRMSCPPNLAQRAPT